MKIGSTFLFLALLSAAGGSGEQELFLFDSKSLEPSKMDIVMREVERFPRSSLLDIEIKSIGSSVGSSFFIMCGVSRLAKVRGDYRYIVKIEYPGASYRMLVGFLNSADETQAVAGEKFAVWPSRLEVIDLTQFAPICGMMK